MAGQQRRAVLGRGLAGAASWALGLAPVGGSGRAWAQAEGLPPASAAARDGRVQLPVPASLADALAQALARRHPLVVMVSLPGCPFCRAVRDGHLGPLVAQQAMPVVQIDMRSRRSVADFEARLTEHDALVRGWGIGTAPSLLFFGPQRREVAARLIGMTLPDFYGAYLDERLAQATRAVAVG